MSKTLNNKLNLCKQTRKIAADTLYKTLQSIIKNEESISEVDLRNRWLSKLQKYSNIFRDGWYIPPPHGIAVILGDDKNIERVDYKTLRPKNFWPKKNEYLNKNNGLVYLFASPVNKEFGIIGDFGVTIYFGDNNKIKDHLILTYRLTKKIFEYAEVGMRLSDLAKYSSQLFKENNVVNIIVSSTDPQGINIGHTIPATEKDWSSLELKTINKSQWEDVCTMISRRRVFINEKNQTKITSGMALTIEPRPSIMNNSTVPMVSLHTIGLFYGDGEKEQLTNFDKIFKLVGMNYML